MVEIIQEIFFKPVIMHLYIYIMCLHITGQDQVYEQISLRRQTSMEDIIAERQLQEEELQELAQQQFEEELAEKGNYLLCLFNFLVF